MLMSSYQKAFTVSWNCVLYSYTNTTC